jgi:hypothetical protein
VGASRYRESIEPVLRPALGADEVLLAASPLVLDPGTADDTPLTDDLKELLNPLLYVGAAMPVGLAERTFGRALLGPADSIAGRLYHAIRGATGVSTVAVTDRGMVLFAIGTRARGGGWFRRTFGAVDRVATLVHRVPHDAVVGAAPAPRGVLRRGRLWVAFTDGSACALVCSPPSLAPPVAAALNP